MQKLRQIQPLVLALSVALVVGFDGCSGFPRKTAPGEAASLSEGPSAAVEIPHQRIAELVDSGDPQRALSLLEQALAGRSPTAGESLLRAELLMATARREEARGLLGTLLRDSPEWIDALLALGFLEAAEGRGDAQRELLQRVLALDPDNPQASATLGSLAAQSGDLDAAAQYYRRAVRRDPYGFEGLYGLGRVALEREQYREAADALEQATRQQPAYAFAWVDLARARAGLADHGGAAAALERAVALEPTSYWHRIDRARELLRLRRWDEALTELTAAVQIDPNTFLAYVYRAGLNDQQGRIEEAIADYESALRLNPEYTFAYGSLGVLYYLMGRWEEAVAALQRATELDPGEPAYALLKALGLRRAERQPEASRYLSDLLAVTPRESWVYDIGRYLADPARETHVIAETERERDRVIRSRRLFYIAAEMLAAGRLRTALAYLSETAGLEQRDLPERRIAEYLLREYGVEDN